MSDWKSKLASKFKSGNKDYDVIGNGEEDGVNIESYKRTSDEFGDSIPSAPRTEPVKRKPMQNGSAVGAHKGVKDDPNKFTMRSSIYFMTCVVGSKANLGITTQCKN